MYGGEKKYIKRIHKSILYITHVLKIKALRKIKNRIKIIIVLANRKARFFLF
nr:MAG TPA: hypothetical protein [Caudoviricetes sp.]